MDMIFYLNGRHDIPERPDSSYFSTNNIAIGMVCGRRKYAFNSPKIRYLYLPN
jgi:hypothetical protein